MKKKNSNILAISAIVFAGFILFKKDEIMEYVEGKIWDIVSEKRINTLHPMVRPFAIQFINEAQKQLGITLRVTDAFRTYAEQNKLYAKGRTAAGKKVTNARGGESNHNFGTAFDVVPMENGQPNYDADYLPIAKLGKSLGFKWGGDWVSLDDKPHFEMNFGYTFKQLRNKFETGKVKDGYVLLA